MRSLIVSVLVAGSLVTSPVSADGGLQLTTSWEFIAYGPQPDGKVVPIYKSTDTNLSANLPALYGGSKWICHQFPVSFQKTTALMEGTITCVHASGALVGVHTFCDPKKPGYADLKTAMVGEGDAAGLISVTCMTVPRPV